METIAYIRTNGIYNDSRATKEISDLANSGRHIIVLSWDRDGKAKNECRNVFQQIKNIDFIFYTAQIDGGIGLRNINKLLGWFVWVYRQTKSINNLNAIHACDLDAGFPAYLLCRKFKLPLIYDVFDYYIDSHPIPKKLISMIEKLENKIINYSSLTIICTEERKEQIGKATPHKTIVIHNSPDVGKVTSSELEYDYVYCGALNKKRLLEPILEQYENNTDLRFCIAGYGEYTEEANLLAKKYDNFIFRGTIPYNEVIDIENKARCLAAIYDPTYRNHRLCAPNKFYEAIALGKPVIVCRDTGIDQIVEKNDIGIVINYNAEEFYAALRFLIASPETCERMGENGRALYEKEYRWEYMRKRLLDAYAAVVK